MVDWKANGGKTHPLI